MPNCDALKLNLVAEHKRSPPQPVSLGTSDVACVERPREFQPAIMPLRKDRCPRRFDDDADLRYAGDAESSGSEGGAGKLYVPAILIRLWKGSASASISYFGASGARSTGLMTFRRTPTRYDKLARSDLHLQLSNDAIRVRPMRL
jgi:hypothetical protein